MMKLLTFIAIALCTQGVALGASGDGSDATCSFVLITTGNDVNSASSASLLEAAVGEIAGENLVVLSPTKPLERGMIGGKVVFSGENALADATDLCESIKAELADSLDDVFGKTTFVVANVLKVSTYVTKTARGSCWAYNWLCWMNCNRGYKPLKTRCCCKSYDESTIIEADPPLASEEPPHHTENLPEIPGNSARLLSDSLIVANVIIFVLQIAFPQVTMFGIKSNELIDQGQIWRFITPAFLHGSPTHLLVNMLSLHSLGPITEWICGRQRFLAIYLFAAFAGDFASYLGDDMPSLGASGAIFGLSGALSIYFWRNRQLFGSRFNGLQFRLLLVIVLNLGSGFYLPQIDEFGHLGGLLGGILAAYVLGPRYELCKVKGEPGVWLIDDPPIEALATPPRKVLD